MDMFICMHACARQITLHKFVVKASWPIHYCLQYEDWYWKGGGCFALSSNAVPHVCTCRSLHVSQLRGQAMHTFMLICPCWPNCVPQIQCTTKFAGKHRELIHFQFGCADNAVDKGRFVAEEGIWNRAHRIQLLSKAFQPVHHHAPNCLAGNWLINSPPCVAIWEELQWKS